MKKIVYTILLPMTFIFFSACAMSESEPESQSILITSENIQQIIEVEWRLLRITENNIVFIEPDKSIPTILFLPDNKVAGSATINRYFGNYMLDAKGVLTWNEPGFASTMMAGPPELMEQEQQYLQKLQKTNRIIKQAQQLVLENADGTIQIIFQRVSESKK